MPHTSVFLGVHGGIYCNCKLYKLDLIFHDLSRLSRISQPGWNPVASKKSSVQVTPWVAPSLVEMEWLVETSGQEWSGDESRQHQKNTSKRAAQNNRAARPARRLWIVGELAWKKMQKDWRRLDLIQYTLLNTTKYIICLVVCFAIWNTLYIQYITVYSQFLVNFYHPKKDPQ